VCLSRARFRVFSNDYGSIQEAKINVLQQGLEKKQQKQAQKWGLLINISLSPNTPDYVF